jgi:hypothetical protein
MIGRQVSSMLFPEWKRDPGFDVVNNLIDASSEVYLRSSLSPIPDAVKPRLLTTPFSTTAFARSTVWRFEASSCKAASKDLPSLPIRLTQTPTKCTVHPVSRVELGKSRRFRTTRDAEQGTEGASGTPEVISGMLNRSFDGHPCRSWRVFLALFVD